MNGFDIAFALEQISVFFGQADAARARVYARLECFGLPADCKLTGTVRGPLSRYARTLAADVPLRPRPAMEAGDGAEPLLAEATVPDPCFWSPETPYMYEVRVELNCGGQPLGATHRLLGIRTLGAHGGRLMWEGCHWVLRGVAAAAVEPPAELAEWRECGAAMIVKQPDDALCEEASRVGVLLAPRLSGNGRAIISQLRRLARWPAVGLALLEPSEPLPVEGSSELLGAVRNVVLVARGDAAPGLAPPWAQARITLEQNALNCEQPVIVQRVIDSAGPLLELRHECDALQRDLAAAFSDARRLVGYVVSP